MINSVAQTKLPSDTFHHRRSTKVSSETYPLYSCVNQFFWFNRSLDICGCSRVSDKGICALSKNCHKLELLDLTSTGVGHKRLVDEPLTLILPLRHHTWSSPRVLDRKIFLSHQYNTRWLIRLSILISCFLYRDVMLRGEVTCTYVVGI